MTAPKVLVVVAHPVIASGIETLLRLEADYDVRRVASIAEASKQEDWRPDVALIDGTLLTGYVDAAIGAPAFVLSGNERDGRQLARKLDDGRGWLRKDATGEELTQAIRSAMRGEEAGGTGLGTLGVVTIALLSLLVLVLVAYLLWLAAY